MTVRLALPLLFIPVLAGQPATKVVVVGYDGLSAAALRTAPAPVMARLRQAGAWTLHARAVLPTVSSPNWASMIMAATPAMHGITSNDWQPDNFTIAPVCHGLAATFPTIFGLLRQQRPHADIAIFHQWKGFARLVEPAAPSIIQNGSDAPDTMHRAIRYLATHKPDLLFIHLDNVDDALHKHGHLSPKYLAAIAEADRLTGQLLDALDANGMRPHTLLLLTADHGGKGKQHSGEFMQDLEIPWILSGPGVRRGVELHDPVNTFDTAATIAQVLGLKPPVCWIGRPVTEAFTGPH
jgi:predicted AlkP superfamily pyrophosphatase or phosphodiesterase